MDLARIRNPVARKAGIIITAFPLLVLVFVFGGLEGAFRSLAQGQRAIVSAWRGH